MKNGLKTTIALFVLLLTSFANAEPISVTYEIGPYGAGGFSASWLHTADHCNSGGPSGHPLCMSGETTGVTGSLTGSFDDGVLSNLGGSLMIDGIEYAILGGSLGGAFEYNVNGMYSNWWIEIDGLGTFYFEGLEMGDGRPNEMSLEELILWGQNLVVYGGNCDPLEQVCDGWGIDLYGRQVSVPEPGTLVLLAAGLFGMAYMQRRRRRQSVSI